MQQADRARHAGLESGCNNSAAGVTFSSSLGPPSPARFRASAGCRPRSPPRPYDAADGPVRSRCKPICSSCADRLLLGVVVVGAGETGRRPAQSGHAVQVQYTERLRGPAGSRFSLREGPLQQRLAFRNGQCQSASVAALQPKPGPRFVRYRRAGGADAPLHRATPAPGDCAPPRC